MRAGKGTAIASLAVLLVLAGAMVRLGRPRATVPGQAELMVYCAAGVKGPISDLARSFQEQHGVPVRIHFGGSGTLLANVQVAAAGDLFVAGDLSYLRTARSRGLVAEILPLAFMRPVIAVPKANPRQIRALDDLLRTGVRVALGNPDASAIGQLTRDLLRKSGHWDALQQQVEKNGVFKPTVPDIAADVALGTVDAGIVWDATAAQFPGIAAVRTDALDAGREQIAVGVLTASAQPTLALRFARYLNSTVGNEAFRRHHYEAVDGDDWAWQPEITFFCGAVNRRAVDGIIKAFQDREGVTINTLYNGCGILTAQMRTIRQDHGGAGFPDTYMACDRYYLQNVAEWFQEDVNVSSADIVIAVPKGNPKQVAALADLAKPGLRVAVGQPEQCTIGALTRGLLEHEGLLQSVMANVVTQTASSAMLVPTVTTQSADAALAYVTDTLAERERVGVVPISSPAAKAVQPFSIACSSHHKYLGRRLLTAIMHGRDAFEKAGFRFLLPEAEETP